MVITVDGPAGAGKTTIARLVAKRLGYSFLDTGAMYRACTWAALRSGIPMDDPRAVVEMVRHLKLEIEDDGDVQRVRVNGKDVTTEIRSENLARHIFHIADPPEIRRELVRLQRAFAQGRDIVTEGRDQGTVAFPEAPFKFYLDASLEERVRRRTLEMEERKIACKPDKLRADMAERDEKDRCRAVGAMKAASDAIVVDTTRMTIEQAAEDLVRRVRDGAKG